MKIGNRTALDAEREALRDAFDSVWINSETMGPRERRAMRCAAMLDQPRLYHASPNWRIGPGWRGVSYPDVLQA